MRVLLVEDDQNVGSVTKRLLKSLGHSVYWVRTGEGATEALESDSTIDVMMLDINLGYGKMSGWDVARFKIESVKAKRIPVIIVSGMGTTRVEDAAALNPLEGAILVMYKPIETDLLKMALKVVEESKRLWTESERES